MTDRVLIPGGKRISPGRLQFEEAFRKALAEGKEVVTGPRAGVYHRVTQREDGSLSYWPFPSRPEGV